jgi:hypothetical protein
LPLRDKKYFLQSLKHWCMDNYGVLIFFWLIFGAVVGGIIGATRKAGRCQLEGLRQRRQGERGHADARLNKEARVKCVQILGK